MSTVLARVRRVRWQSDKTKLVMTWKLALALLLLCGIGGNAVCQCWAPRVWPEAKSAEAARRRASRLAWARLVEPESSGSGAGQKRSQTECMRTKLLRFILWPAVG